MEAVELERIAVILHHMALFPVDEAQVKDSQTGFQARHEIFEVIFCTEVGGETHAADGLEVISINVVNGRVCAFLPIGFGLIVLLLICNLQAFHVSLYLGVSRGSPFVIAFKIQVEVGEFGLGACHTEEQFQLGTDTQSVGNLAAVSQGQFSVGLSEDIGLADVIVLVLKIFCYGEEVVRKIESDKSACVDGDCVVAAKSLEAHA